MKSTVVLDSVEYDEHSKELHRQGKALFVLMLDLMVKARGEQVLCKSFVKASDYLEESYMWFGKLLAENQKYREQGLPPKLKVELD